MLVGVNSIVSRVVQERLACVAYKLALALTLIEAESLSRYGAMSGPEYCGLRADLSRLAYCRDSRAVVVVESGLRSAE
jgi:hypothetical protein